MEGDYHNIAAMFVWAAGPALEEVKKYLESVKKYPNPPPPNMTKFPSG